MKRIWCLVIMVFFVATGLSSAFGAEKTEKSEWWKELKAKIEKISPTKSQITTTAVGGVRGTKQTESESLYWKRSSTTAKEIDDFNAALDLAIRNEKAKAIAGFEDFLKKYPSSPLASEAQESLKILEEE
ncbi:MAG: hypothetical protein HY773_01360 [Candidatus Terrybacteria bacterium]|nr:hypothetical protein [Candidatus Terrybacteria bacterium]